MKVLFVVASILLFAQALVQQKAPATFLDCFDAFLVEAEQSDREDLKTWAENVRSTDERFNAQRLECDNLTKNGEIIKKYNSVSRVLIYIMYIMFQIHHL